MDGGGRLLRALGEAGLRLIGTAQPRLAGWPSGYEAAPLLPPRPLTRRERRVLKRAGFWQRLTRWGALGFVLTATVLGGTGLYGSMRNGDYAAFVQAYGSPFDLAARTVGFSIRAITITGPKVLEAPEILTAAGIDPTRSLLFLSASDVRARLMAVPLVRDAVVTRLFPNRLTIAIEERDPVALWQKDGRLSIVSGDGVVIDSDVDDRFASLPFVVGEGANVNVGEFLALLDKAGDLRGRIVAGIRVGDRRWDLKMDNGLRVALPETDPATAVQELATLDHQGKLLDKDLVSVDLRMPGRLTVRLSEDAAAARALALAKKAKPKGSQP